jgi:hypothetical protein
MKTAGKNKIFAAVVGIDWAGQKHDTCLFKHGIK